MKKYIVTKISEQDYGCEELPEGQKYCVDVTLKDNQNNIEMKLSIPDSELYSKKIDINSIVTYDGKKIELANS